jgi:Na+/H+-translocating membrane pyrophosphatase
LVSTSKGFLVSIFGKEKTVELSILVPIFLGIFFFILALVMVFLFVMKKKNKDRERVYLAVSTVTAISVLINTAGEFFLRWLLKGIVLSSSEAALVDSIAKLPSNLITGVATILFVSLIYLPVYLALHHAGFDQYIIHTDIEEEQEMSINTNEI